MIERDVDIVAVLFLNDHEISYFYNPSFNSTLHYTCVDTRAVNTLVIHYLRNHAFEAVRLPGYSIYK